MRLGRSCTLGLLSLLLPFIAHAEKAALLDFQDGKIPGDWTVRNLTGTEKTSDGLHITTGQDGLMVRTITPPATIDVVTVTLQSRTGVKIGLLWHPLGSEDGRYSQFFFTVDASDEPVTVDIAPGTLPTWNTTKDQIGFALPGGSDIVLQSITLRSWSFGERMAEAWKSFWTLDGFQPHSINFLWGPLIAYNPIERAQLFDRHPPLAISGVRIFYAILILTFIAGAVAYGFSRRSPKVLRSVLQIGAIVTISVWLIFDLRMGGELLQYVRTDWQTNVLQPVGHKRLRTHGDFYDVAQRALPSLHKDPKYALLIPDRSPFYSNLRYMTYPSLPVQPGGDTAGIGMLFVYQRPDITVEENRVMAADGTMITDSGRVILDFGSGSFLYATTP